MLVNFDDLWPSDPISLSSQETTILQQVDASKYYHICGKEVPHGYWVGILLYYSFWSIVVGSFRLEKIIKSKWFNPWNVHVFAWLTSLTSIFGIVLELKLICFSYDSAYNNLYKIMWFLYVLETKWKYTLTFFFFLPSHHPLNPLTKYINFCTCKRTCMWFFMSDA